MAVIRVTRDSANPDTLVQTQTITYISALQDGGSEIHFSGTQKIKVEQSTLELLGMILAAERFVVGVAH